MGIFTDVDEIRRLSDELGALVRKRFREVARMDAEEIAENLIEEKGLDTVCRDINNAISEASDMIHEAADTNVTYDFDNFLLATFDPYPEREEVDDYIIKESACAEEPEFFVTKAAQLYAYELWRVGIRKELEEILKEKCAGVVKRSLARIRVR